MIQRRYSEMLIHLFFCSNPKDLHDFCVGLRDLRGKFVAIARCQYVQVYTNYTHDEKFIRHTKRHLEFS